MARETELIERGPLESAAGRDEAPFTDPGSREKMLLPGEEVAVGPGDRPRGQPLSWTRSRGLYQSARSLFIYSTARLIFYNLI
jgi:hypothetical protein